MKLQKTINKILCLGVALVMLLSQTVFVSANAYRGDDHEERPYRFMAMGGAEVASDTSLRVYWGDFTTAGQGYRIMWSIQNSGKWRSVEISDPEPDSYLKAKSFLITGLTPNQEYDIRISAILKDEKGKTYTEPMKISGCTYLKTPVCSNASTSGKDYIESMWFVHEKNAKLKIYRSDTKNGKYKLIKTTDGKENACAVYRKDCGGIIMFRDTNVKPGRSYYYKAVSKLVLDDGRVLTKESQPDRLKTKSGTSEDLKFTGSLLGKQNTGEKVLTWKVTSAKHNRNVTLLADDMVTDYMKWTRDGFHHKQPEKAEYSFDGKKYSDLKNSVTLKSGKNIYLRVTLPDQVWVGPDTIGILSVAVKYYGETTSQASYKKGTLALHMDDWVEFREQGKGYFDTLDWRATYAAWLYHGHDLALTGTVNAQKNVVLTWNLCPYAEKYSIRYGASEAEAARRNAIEVSKGQFAYQVKNLKAGQSYVFIVSETYQGDDGKMKEEDETITIKVPVSN